MEHIDPGRGELENMAGLVFYSSASGNTARFVEALGVDAKRIPISPSEALPEPEAPFALICPTFADGEGRGAVPKRVITFLNDPRRRGLLRGVIAAGNRNFGDTFALAGDVIAAKCNIPVLYRFELSGNETDLSRVREGLAKMGLIHLQEEKCLTL